MLRMEHHTYPQLPSLSAQYATHTLRRTERRAQAEPCTGKRHRGARRTGPKTMRTPLTPLPARPPNLPNPSPPTPTRFQTPSLPPADATLHSPATPGTTHRPVSQACHTLQRWRSEEREAGETIKRIGGEQGGKLQDRASGEIRQREGTGGQIGGDGQKRSQGGQRENQ